MDPVAAYIREQPEVVPASYRAVREALAGRTFAGAGEIALVGSGSSLNALTAMAPVFSAATGRPVRLVGPSAFAAEPAGSHGSSRLAIVLSQSGASRTTIEAAQLAVASGSEVVRITAEAESPFAALAPGTILMPVGAEPIGPKTKGYTASLAALAALADHLGGRPQRVPSIDRDEIEASRDAAEALLASLGVVDYVLIAGSGAHLGTALEASLKISEMSGIPAAGFETEEALHGRLHGLTERSLGIFIAGSRSDSEPATRSCRTMRALGCRTFVLAAASAETLTFQAEPVDSPPVGLDPTRAIIPFQWLARGLAHFLGRDPAAMRYPDLSARLAIKTHGPSR